MFQNQKNGGDNSCSQSTETHPPPQPHITTKVTATAKLKVEVHTPIGMCSLQYEYYVLSM